MVSARVLLFVDGDSASNNDFAKKETCDGQQPHQAQVQKGLRK